MHYFNRIMSIKKVPDIIIIKDLSDVAGGGFEPPTPGL